MKKERGQERRVEYKLSLNRPGRGRDINTLPWRALDRVNLPGFNSLALQMKKETETVKAIRLHCIDIFGEGDPLCWGVFKPPFGEIILSDEGVCYTPSNCSEELFAPWSKALKTFDGLWEVILSHPIEGKILEGGVFIY